MYDRQRLPTRFDNLTLQYCTVTPLLIKDRVSMTDVQHELDSVVCLVNSLHCGGPKFKSNLSVPLLKAASARLLSFSFFRLHNP